MTKYEISGAGRPYFTDNVDSRDYILTQKSDKKIYNIELKPNISFAPVSGISGRCTISKVDSDMYVIDWTNGIVYKENSGGGFSEILRDAALKNQADGCICQKDGQLYLCALRSAGSGA